MAGFLHDAFVFADGAARVPVIRRLKIQKPSSPPPWHSLLGTSSVHRSTTLPVLLSAFQVSLDDPAQDKARRVPTSDVAALPGFVDPLDVEVDLLCPPSGTGSHVQLNAQQLAHFLLRKVDDQLSSESTPPHFPRDKLPHSFAILRRMISHGIAAYTRSDETPDALHRPALELYALLVALKALRCAVLQLPEGRSVASRGFHAGAVEGAEPASAHAVFIDQLNALLAAQATTSVACLAAPLITEVIMDTLSRGARAKPQPSVTLALLLMIFMVFC